MEALGIKHYKIFGRYFMSYGWWMIHTTLKEDAVYSKVLSFYKLPKVLMGSSTIIDIFLKHKIITRSGSLDKMEEYNMGIFGYKNKEKEYL